ncbi:hypothetical protein BV25DRAFT_1901453 [Artomyces pyxidatus]|uniref:Uncharacterized protein n=1 Tax=Artomyces pyxidatus TaxID=48021 RepID=A0ACB8STF3_9AGAM|nr:hypothetical protein BV25DRAFT_1901453 [Artomyces pyxidatus]
MDAFSNTPLFVDVDEANPSSSIPLDFDGVSNPVSSTPVTPYLVFFTSYVLAITHRLCTPQISTSSSFAATRNLQQENQQSVHKLRDSCLPNDEQKETMMGLDGPGSMKAGGWRGARSWAVTKETAMDVLDMRTRGTGHLQAQEIAHVDASCSLPPEAQGP